jgi:hypothetical protein
VDFCTWSTRRSVLTCVISRTGVHCLPRRPASSTCPVPMMQKGTLPLPAIFLELSSSFLILPFNWRVQSMKL